MDFESLKKTLRVTAAGLGVGLAAVLILPLTASLQERRVTLTISDVTVSPDDSLVVVPVYISFPYDSLAAAEVHFKLEENRHLYFASDDIGDDGLLIAADTAGTVMSGWEWVAVNSLDNTIFDLKVSGLADWPDTDVTPPVPPQQRALFTTLYLRNDLSIPMEKNERIGITVNLLKSGFSDPAGYSIGVVTRVDSSCIRYEGDSCLTWKTVRTGTLDSAVVNFVNGSITIAGEGVEKQ